MKKPSQRTIPCVAGEQVGVERTANLVAAQERVMSHQIEPQTPRQDPPDWKKVPFDAVRARVKGIPALADLSDEAVTALAVLICAICRYPPELGTLVSKAKDTILELETWLEVERMAPAFRKKATQFLVELDSLRRTHFSSAITFPTPMGEFVFCSDPKHPGDFEAIRRETLLGDAVPEEPFLLARASAAGQLKRQTELMILAMGIIQEDRNLAATRNKTPPTRNRPVPIAFKDEEKLAALLDEFWRSDNRLDGDRNPGSALRQYRAALKGCRTPLKTTINSLRKPLRIGGYPADFAWLPVRKTRSE